MSDQACPGLGRARPRIKLIALTDRGRELREELNRRMAEPPEVLTRLSAADQRALRDVLRRAVGA